ncbi:MAG: hypothetical protein BGO31_03005 [Bacteroidetes bacterium 43-16]|nr:MAG: hypothetical protein BGO31_03005 [Bacteroidetes bacterium 43-16]
MNIEEQVKAYINSQDEHKRSDMQALHQLILQILPKGKLGFFDGMNNENNPIANPTIGYGSYTIKYANGTSREFFQIGLSANKAGISVHILGIKDKTSLAQNFDKEIGKASVSGYCIKFKSCKAINTRVLETAIRYGIANSNTLH